MRNKKSHFFLVKRSLREMDLLAMKSVLRKAIRLGDDSPGFAKPNRLEADSKQLVRLHDLKLQRETISWFSGATGESAAVQRHSTESRASREKRQGLCGCEGVFSATVWRVTGKQKAGTPPVQLGKLTWMLASFVPGCQPYNLFFSISSSVFLKRIRK
ncbi:hypothetical protein ILYODFUR_028472 [Ilyodon furcidens]|uniref:Uncharacterized protein n=1 Tax=Ilyodon furcidens TaxID=33524 RepID=A0ABV0TZ04_9TELE